MQISFSVINYQVFCGWVLWDCKSLLSHQTLSLFGYSSMYASFPGRFLSVILLSGCSFCFCLTSSHNSLSTSGGHKLFQGHLVLPFCFRTGIVLASVIVQGVLVFLSGEWYRETKIMTMGVLTALRASQLGEYMRLYAYIHTHTHTLTYLYILNLKIVSCS